MNEQPEQYRSKVFAVHDHGVGAYMQPFFMQSIGQATRAFIDLATDQKTQICQHPKDFVLFQIGTYDEYSGRLHALPTPLPILSGLQAQEAAGSTVAVGRGEIPPPGEQAVETKPERPWLPKSQEMGAPNGSDPKARAKLAVEKHSERNA